MPCQLCKDPVEKTIEVIGPPKGWSAHRSCAFIPTQPLIYSKCSNKYIIGPSNSGLKEKIARDDVQVPDFLLIF
jgi:hypothetical protein